MSKFISLKNQYGVTLLELLAAVVLVGILAVGFALAMTVYIQGYNETKDYLQLQQDMMNLMDAIRHGYTPPPPHNLLNAQRELPGLIGLSTASRVNIGINGDEIIMAPVDPDGRGGYRRYFVHIRRNQHTGEVLYSAQYNLLSVSNVIIFPSLKTRIGGELKYQIVNSNSERKPGLYFEDVTREITGDIPRAPDRPDLVRIVLTGRVRFREKRPNESQEEDLRKNVKFAQFETVVFVSHVDKIN